MANQALPASTRRLVDRHQDECRHLGLMLDKFAPWNEVSRRPSGIPQWELTARDTSKKRPDLQGGEAKTYWLSIGRPTNRDSSPRLFDRPRIDVALMQMQAERWKSMVDSYAALGTRFPMVTSAPLVVGLGASHVLETTLTLDRNSGVPTLAGSSLKGLAQAVKFTEVVRTLGYQLDDDPNVLNQKLKDLDEALTKAPKLKKEEAEYAKGLPPAERNEFEEQQYIRNTFKMDRALEAVWEYRQLFGHQGSAGAVNFLHAVCLADTHDIFTTQVMTPHFGEYYRGSKLPSDDDNPNPVTFLAVKAGVPFAFGLVARRRDEQRWLNMAAQLLQRGLIELGVGGKTASGLGVFRPIG